MTIRDKTINRNDYSYEQKSVRVGKKVTTTHVRYIGKSSSALGTTGYISKSGQITDNYKFGSIPFKKEDDKIIVNQNLNDKQEEELHKIYKHREIVQPEKKEDVLKNKYYLYNPSTGKRESFYRREDAEQRADSIQIETQSEYKPNINKDE